MHYTYDPQADALYVYLREGMSVVRTIALDERRNVDLDGEDRIIGIEVLSPGVSFPIQDLFDRFELVEYKDFLESVASTTFKPVSPANP